MILTLRVLSGQGQGLPKNASKSFFETGATIGRRGDNDWVLPDPSRLISGQHAIIDFQDGNYYLTDTSTNGTFINSPDSPIGKGARVALHDGDRLYVGDYVMEARLETAGSVSADQPMQDLDSSLDDGFMPEYGWPVDDEPTNAQVPLPEQFRADRWGDLGAQRDDIPATGEQFEPPQAFPEPEIPADEATLEATLADEPIPGEPPPRAGEVIPTDWDFMGEESIPPRPFSEGPLTPPEAASAEAEPDWETPAREELPERNQASAHPMPAKEAFSEGEPTPATQAPAAPPPVIPTARAEPPQRPAQGPAAPAAPAAGRTFDPVAEFLQGAGLDSLDLSEEGTQELMRVAGGVFRETVAGLGEALRARAEFKRGFRVQQTVIRPVENNPLKFAVGDVEERMRTLLFRQGSGYMPPLDAVQEGFKDLEAHQLAMVVGMKAALQLLLSRFDPQGLEKQLEERGGRTHVLPMAKKAKLWEQYLRLYEALSRDIEDDFQAVFGNEFVSAYEQQVRSIEKERKKHPGGDHASAR